MNTSLEKMKVPMMLSMLTLLFFKEGLATTWKRKENGYFKLKMQNNYVLKAVMISITLGILELIG